MLKDNNNNKKEAGKFYVNCYICYVFYLNRYILFIDKRK